MNEDTSLNDFLGAFDDSADYQTGGNEDTSMEEDISLDGGDAEQDTREDPEGAESAAEDPQEQPEGGAEQPAGDQPQSQESPEETFTLKVNKEEKTYSREEVISLAQKGADYDRVKGQLEQSRQTAEELQGKLDGQQEAMDVLSELAKNSSTDIPGILRNLRLGLLKQQGLSDEAAEERLLRMDAERENAALKAAAKAEEPPQETSAQRAQRELAELREVYPNAELSQEVLSKLMPDVQGGMPLLEAYHKYENAQKDAQIAELQRQLAAEKQNKENIATSPGSQKDSGGKRTKSDYDDFLEAFE